MPCTALSSLNFQDLVPVLAVAARIPLTPGIMATHTPNPLQDTHSSPPPLVSAQTFHIAGILATVYGLEEVLASSRSISCLWLLHPRLQTKQIMANVAATCINDYHRRSADHKDTAGLIAVAFDQRNHGSREVNALANEAWKQGNKSHAQVKLPMPNIVPRLIAAGHV